MTVEELKARVQKRLATIQQTKDEGVYARHYAQDVSELLAALEEATARDDSGEEASAPQP